MLFKAKRNPVYELQKNLEKEKVLLGKIDENGQVETDDKIMYGIIEKIFEIGKDNTKKVGLKNKLIWGLIGLFIGTIGTLLLFYMRLLKP